MNERTIPIQCGSIHVRWWGPGDAVETVVILHGGPGLAARYLDPLVPFVDNGRRRIVSYDQRGVGQSPCDRDDLAGYSLDAYADDLARVVDEVAVGAVHLLGHSWGGILAMDHATRHHERLASITLVGSAPPDRESLNRAEASMEARIAALQDRGLIPTQLPDGATATDGLRSILPMYLWDPARPMPPEAVASIEVTPRINELTLKALGAFDLTAPLRTYRGRALLVFGEADPIGVPAFEATRAALANSLLRSELMERTGHFPWLESPERFGSILEAFLEG